MQRGALHTVSREVLRNFVHFFYCFCFLFLFSFASDGETEAESIELHRWLVRVLGQGTLASH